MRAANCRINKHVSSMKMGGLYARPASLSPLYLNIRKNHYGFRIYAVFTLVAVPDSLILNASNN